MTREHRMTTEETTELLIRMIELVPDYGDQGFFVTTDSESNSVTIRPINSPQ